MWHHIVYYVDDSVLEITINNGPTFSLAHTIAFDYGANKEVVLGGTHEAAANNPFLGSMDDLRFYNRKLTAGEITALFTTINNCSESGIPTAAFVTPSLRCVGQLATFTNQSSPDATSFVWNMPGGNPSTSTGTNASTVYNAPGIYTISLIASNAGGSTVTATHTMQVGSCTSIMDAQQEETILFYPNPASSSVWLTARQVGQVAVKDIYGKQMTVKMSQGENNTIHIDVTDLLSGLYFIEFETEDGKVHSGKVIVTK